MSLGRTVQVRVAAYRLGYPAGPARARTAQQTTGPREATDVAVVTCSLTLRPLA